MLCENISIKLNNQNTFLEPASCYHNLIVCGPQIYCRNLCIETLRDEVYCLQWRHRK